MPAGITSNFRTPVLILMWENPSLSSNPLRTALGYASAPAVHIGNSTTPKSLIQPKTKGKHGAQAAFSPSRERRDHGFSAVLYDYYCHVCFAAVSNFRSRSPR